MSLTSANLLEMEEIRRLRDFDEGFRAMFEPVLDCHALLRERLPAYVWEAIEKRTTILRRKLGRRSSDSLDDYMRLFTVHDLFVGELVTFYRRYVGPLDFLSNGPWRLTGALSIGSKGLRHRQAKAAPGTKRRAKRRNREGRG